MAGRWRSFRLEPLGHVVDLDRRDVPLGQDDHRRAAGLAGLVGHSQVALDEALGGVDQDERDVRALGGFERPHLAVVLDPLAVAALAAKAGGVDQAKPPLAPLERSCRSHRGSSRASAPRSPGAGRGSRSRATTCRRWAGRGSRRGSRRRPPRRHPPARRRPRARAAARRPRRAGRRRRGRAAPRPAIGSPRPSRCSSSAPASCAASSTLFATTSTGRRERRRISAISSSPAVSPARASITTAPGRPPRRPAGPGRRPAPAWASRRRRRRRRCRPGRTRARSSRTASRCGRG